MNMNIFMFNEIMHSLILSFYFLKKNKSSFNVCEPKVSLKFLPVSVNGF